MNKKIKEILHNEKIGGLVLIICTIVSLVLANSFLSEDYLAFWHIQLSGFSLELFINDFLMAIFFLMVGLELVREFKIGEFSTPKNAILPFGAALGGMIVPAAIYLLFNWGKSTQSGFGIPMATDIAFALGVLSMLGSRVPSSLKIFLMALAVIDDLGAIVMIAIFYTQELMLTNLLLALTIFIVLLILNKLKVKQLLPYILGGLCMWYFMFTSGVHATIAGVLLAFTIPFDEVKDKPSLSLSLLHKLYIPVTFIILPLFALANTAIKINPDWHGLIDQPLAFGIMGGLIVGKPLGITLACFLLVVLGISKLPRGVTWKSFVGTAMLGGIGFTMSIFIALLAFTDVVHINNAKIIVLISSLCAGILGFCILNLSLDKSFKNRKL